MKALFGGVEAGGTKFVCAVGDAGGALEKQIVLPTTTPAETLRRVVEFFETARREAPIAALGVASFGPVDLDPLSPRYGCITAPPKPGWSGVDILGTLREAFDVPMGFDTDVNGAALGEHRWGAARGLDTFLYYTVGTGIGAGGMVSGRLMHGLLHPEMGHMFIPHDRSRDDFPGVCPFHGDCLEGLASGPSMERRWKVKSASELPEDHPAWDLEARYLAFAFANSVCAVSPQRVILGGGVGKNPQLLPRIREQMRGILNGYIRHESILGRADEFIVAPGLGERSGICGALALAESSHAEARGRDAGGAGRSRAARGRRARRAR